VGSVGVCDGVCVGVDVFVGVGVGVSLIVGVGVGVVHTSIFVDVSGFNPGDHTNLILLPLVKLSTLVILKLYDPGANAIYPAPVEPPVSVKNSCPADVIVNDPLANIELMVMLKLAVPELVPAELYSDHTYTVLP
jgi:hypothetical protein